MTTPAGAERARLIAEGLIRPGSEFARRRIPRDAVLRVDDAALEAAALEAVRDVGELRLREMAGGSDEHMAAAARAELARRAALRDGA